MLSAFLVFSHNRIQGIFYWIMHKAFAIISQYPGMFIEPFTCFNSVMYLLGGM
jgi:hypothetical protein